MWRNSGSQSLRRHGEVGHLGLRTLVALNHLIDSRHEMACTYTSVPTPFLGVYQANNYDYRHTQMWTESVKP